VSIDDVKTPKAKKELLDGYEAQADKVETQFKRASSPTASGASRRSASGPTRRPRCKKAMEAEFKAQRFNPIDMMVGSAPEEHDARCARSPACEGWSPTHVAT
jgi:DNA-directed RNA polymerase subunit beta'